MAAATNADPKAQAETSRRAAPIPSPRRVNRRRPIHPIATNIDQTAIPRRCGGGAGRISNHGGSKRQRRGAAVEFGVVVTVKTDWPEPVPGVIVAGLNEQAVPAGRL